LIESHQKIHESFRSFLGVPKNQHGQPFCAMICVLEKFSCDFLSNLVFKSLSYLEINNLRILAALSKSFHKTEFDTMSESLIFLNMLIQCCKAHPSSHVKIFQILKVRPIHHVNQGLNRHKVASQLCHESWFGQQIRFDIYHPRIFFR